MNLHQSDAYFVHLAFLLQIQLVVGVRDVLFQGFCSSLKAS